MCTKGVAHLVLNVEEMNLQHLSVSTAMVLSREKLKYLHLTSLVSLKQTQNAGYIYKVPGIAQNVEPSTI